MLIRPASPKDERGDENMQISTYSQLGLFAQEFYPGGSTSENAEGVLVTYNPPEKTKKEGKGSRAKNGVLLSEEGSSLRVPFRPDTKGLARRRVNLHKAECLAYDMGDSPYSEFFTRCLGIEVRLLYLGPGDLRTPLGNVAPPKKSSRSWLGVLKQEKDNYGITFSDCAPLLIVTEWSVDDVSRRFLHASDGETHGGMDISKFRPNIVLGPQDESPDHSPNSELIPAWDEDYWAELACKDKSESYKIVLTQNCARCRAINVDYESGEFGDVKMPGGEEPLKYLMKDRRVDPGNKWSPVFGRYGFLDGQESIKVDVGDTIEVTRRNKDRTVFCEFSDFRVT